MVLTHEGKTPDLDKAGFIAPSADIIGEVSVGSESSIWFNVTIRGDVASVTIGDRSNVQDNAVVHVNNGMPTVIGDDVTVGHGAIVHACTIGNRCLVGMGSIILDQAVIGDECLVAAGALVPPRKHFPPRSFIIGSPAKAVRELTDEELARIRTNTGHYVTYGASYAAEAQI